MNILLTMQTIKKVLKCHSANNQFIKPYLLSARDLQKNMTRMQLKNNTILETQKQTFSTSVKKIDIYITYMTC